MTNGKNTTWTLNVQVVFLIMLTLVLGVVNIDCMITAKEKISIPKTEYLRLKEIDKRFNSFWTYLKNSTEIKEARKEIKQKKAISQEKLFKKLGL